MAEPTGTSRVNSAALFKKEYAEDVIHDQLMKEATLYPLFLRQGKGIDEGLDFTFFLRDALSDAGRGFGEWDDLAKPRHISNVKAVYNMKAYNRTVRGSGQAEVSGGSVIKPLVQDIQQLVPSMALDFERFPFMESTGKLAGCVDADDATTLNIDAYQLVVKGMYVDVLIESSGEVAYGVSNARITRVVPDKTTGTAVLTLSENLNTYGSIDTTYVIVPSGAYNQYAWGFSEILSDANPASGNVGAIDRTIAGNEYWQVEQHDAQGSRATGNFLADVLADINTDTGKKPTLILAHDYVHNDLIDEQKNKARTHLDKKHFEMFGDSLAIRGVPIVSHRFMPFDKMYLLYMPEWKMCHPKGLPSEGRWMDKRSGQSLENVPNKWGFQAAWVRMHQLVCLLPRANAVIKNLNWARYGTAA